jgi:ketosteroid isomerase-like protein
MPRTACALLALLLALAPASRAGDAPSPDEPAIRELNDAYIRAFLACDVARFRGLLADDFSGVLADGRVIDKDGFLALASAKPDAQNLRLSDVAIRVYGDTALVVALVTYEKASGATVRTRYSSVFLRRDGKWAIVAVQWTRAVAK